MVRLDFTIGACFVAPDDLAWAPQPMRPILRGKEPWHVGVQLEVENAGLKLAPDELRTLGVEGILDRATGEGKPRKAPNGEPFHLKIVASTETLARDNGIIPMAAWERDIARYFPENPVVLYGHGRLPPIGKTVDLRIKKSAGRMEQWWLFNDITDLSREVHALYELGDLRAASVGFRVLEWHRATEDELKKMKRKHPDANEFTWIVDRAELVETSAVPVPADPKALASGTARLEEDLRAVLASDESRPEMIEDLAVRAFAVDLRETRQRLPLPDLETRYLQLVRACDEGNTRACDAIRGEIPKPKPSGTAQPETATTDTGTTREEADARVARALAADEGADADLAAAVRALETLLTSRSVDQLGLVTIREAGAWLGEHRTALERLAGGDMALALDVIENAVRARIEAGEALEFDDDDTVELDCTEAELRETVQSAVGQHLVHA